MTRIDTEHGPVYVGKPDEQINSNQIEPDKRADDTKFQTSWVCVTVAGLLFFIVGFIVGLVLMGDPAFRLTGFITIILLAIALRYARVTLIKYESAHLEMLQEARNGEMEILNRRREILQLENKQLASAERVAKSDSKSTNGVLFTASDFDDAAQALLLKPVKEARKKKLRVTGQGLIETILKGIR